MLEIGISGGTYNPIHNWHLVVADCARQQFGFGETLFIPNGDPAHKDGTLDRFMRLEMVQLAIESNPHFRASRIEVDREGKSYMLDTLKELRRQYGNDARLNLIIGLDVLEPIMTWHGAEQVLKMVRLLVAPRSCEMACPTKIRKVLPAGTQFDVIDCPSSPISSSMIRDRVKQGKSIRYLVPESVHEVIMTRGYYQGGK